MGKSAPPRLVCRSGVLVPRRPAEPVLLSPKLDQQALCAISNDGRRVAFQDNNAVVHLWDLTRPAELGSWSVPDGGELMFTAHGLAVVPAPFIPLFGGPARAFSPPIPPSRSSHPHP